jgi:transcriptional regulator with XRE-family HTH domain
MDRKRCFSPDTLPNFLTPSERRRTKQNKLERRCGLAHCRISWLEQGRAVPTLKTLERIADALEIPIHRLLLQDQERVHDRRLPVDSGKQGSGR